MAYGIVNALYYTVAITIIWCCVDGDAEPLLSPGALGATAAAAGTGKAAMSAATSAPSLRLLSTRFLKAVAMAWAGSQVTKPLRVGGAILLAPAVSRLMGYTERKLQLRSKRQTLAVLLAALMVFPTLVFAGLLIKAGAWEAAAPMVGGWGERLKEAWGRGSPVVASRGNGGGQGPGGSVSAFASCRLGGGEGGKLWKRLRVGRVGSRLQALLINKSGSSAPLFASLLLPAPLTLAFLQPSCPLPSRPPSFPPTL